MKRSLLFLPLILIACTSFLNTIKNGEVTTTHLVFTGYVGWTNVYAYLTNKYAGDPVKLADIEKTRLQLKQARLDYSASVSVLDSWIAAYQSNAVSQSQVQAVFDATMANSSNFLYLYSVATNKF